MSTDSRLTAVAIIPARYASERFPGKVIASLLGKPLVLHVYERASEASFVSEVIIATDDPRVVDALAPFGAHTVLTDSAHTTGTDRIAEVANTLDVDIVVNVQGDEPLVDPRVIDAMIQALADDSSASMSTARLAISDPELIADTNCVKVVTDQRGHAIYFSRLPIPCVRDSLSGREPLGTYWQHLGLYAFRREFLLRFAKLTPTPLERAEKLEQLRAIEHGYSIAVVDAHEMSIGVDTPRDLERARQALEARGSQTDR